MAVVGGICHSALARLSKTLSYLSDEDKKVQIKMNFLLTELIWALLYLLIFLKVNIGFS
jgi:hypothetical protein